MALGVNTSYKRCGMGDRGSMTFAPLIPVPTGRIVAARSMTCRSSAATVTGCRIWAGPQHLALTAVREALADAALRPGTFVPERTGIILGTTSGEALCIEEADAAWQLGQAPAFPASLYAAFSSNIVAATMAEYFGLRGPVLMLTNACSSGNFAIDYGREMILQGEADIIIAGGAEALSKVALTGFSSLHAVAPEQCQPFDRKRKGMMVSEGAGVVVLEAQRQAERRGAHTYAAILGSGLGCDAFHLTAPDPQGMADVMRRALDDAGLPPSCRAIDYINAHGTGTELNDAAETEAIKMVFGDEAYQIPVSSIKSMIGHTLGASSAIETVACCLALEHHFLPPTINYRDADAPCDLDYVPQQARWQRVEVIMNNSFAFGGNNASLILGRSGRHRQPA